MSSPIQKTGITLLDAEHENILGLAGLCLLTCPHYLSRHDCDGCQDGSPDHCRHALRSVFDHLLPGIQKHFDEEESVMRQLGLEQKDPRHLAVHLSAHQHLLSDLRISAAVLIANPEDRNVVSHIRRLQDYVADSLQIHTDRMDAKLIPHLAK